ncbi:MAG TPA: TetR/AcrR family transcriptional regulator [Ktedonobacteraceae bacterium]|nr:TetR/AcrR family transcriptional regulator [Ktedonobacteraceae bacterium]
MSEPGSRRSGQGRVHDAEGTRTAILDAAEEVFAENGFDGARIDVIAAKSGYNKSLIFHYFGDKLGLYAEVLKRADRDTTELQARVLIPMLADEAIASDAQRFRSLLETTVTILFDYLVDHPRLMRILLWEQAEGWQTYAKIASQFDTADIQQFEALFRVARKAGLLRSDINPVLQLTIALQICLSYLSFIPMYQLLLPDEDFSSTKALERVREQLVKFVVAGMMVDLPEKKL